MQVVKLCMIGNSVTLILPASIVDALHLHENDEIVVEVAGDHIVLTKPSPDFRDAWNAYQQIELGYREANRKLSE